MKATGQATRIKSTAAPYVPYSPKLLPGVPFPGDGGQTPSE